MRTSFGIGDTPLIRLARLPDASSAEVWVKLEGANPTGSKKDRMALSMIEGAERRGQLKPGGKVVEYTGGSTGSSLAMVCAAKGYQAHFVSSDCFAEEKIRTMRAFGAHVEIVPSTNRMITKELIGTMLDRIAELGEQPGVYCTDQFNNPDNPAGYHAMAQELLDQLAGRIDAFVDGVGTGGSFTGNATVLKHHAPGVLCVATEPANSRALSGVGEMGGHRLEGMGPGFVPHNFKRELADEIIAVTDEDAYETARTLAVQEGVFGGISSGCNVWAALQVARRLGPGKRVLAVICDSGLKYLDGDLFS